MIILMTTVNVLDGKLENLNQEKHKEMLDLIHE